MANAVGALVAAGFLFAASAGAAAAQDASAAPNFGSVALTSGFQPDPHNVSVVSGGTINVASTIGGACTGFVSNAPDFDLTYTAGSVGLPLIISVMANSDTTLVVNAPDGTWFCDDDSGEGLNPRVTFTKPTSGLYDIWVGTVGSASNIAATLTISETSSR